MKQGPLKVHLPSLLHFLPQRRLSGKNESGSDDIRVSSIFVLYLHKRLKQTKITRTDRAKKTLSFSKLILQVLVLNL